MLWVVAWELRREEENSHGSKKQMFGKQMYDGPRGDSGTESALISSVPHHIRPMFLADISGHRFIWGIGLLSKLF